MSAVALVRFPTFALLVLLLSLCLVFLFATLLLGLDDLALSHPHFLFVAVALFLLMSGSVITAKGTLVDNGERTGMRIIVSVVRVALSMTLLLLLRLLLWLLLVLLRERERLLSTVWIWLKDLTGLMRQRVLRAEHSQPCRFAKLRSGLSSKRLVPGVVAS